MENQARMSDIQKALVIGETQSPTKAMLFLQRKHGIPIEMEQFAGIFLILTYSPQDLERAHELLLSEQFYNPGVMIWCDDAISYG